MRISQKALILAVVTESITIALFIAARGSQGVFPPALWFLRHTPAILLIWLELPWLLKTLIGAALWMLFCFVMMLLFAGSKNELMMIRLSVHQSKTRAPSESQRRDKAR